MNIICHHGIDLVDCRRIEDLLRRHGERFLARVYTPAERQYCRRHVKQVERLAGRFAVKEAVMKMLGTGWQNGVTWTDIETTNDATGRPAVRLSNKTADLARAMGVEQISVSITHTADLAIASVVGLTVKV
jgi:holo-[acyl-carrier protein] synthase